MVDRPDVPLKTCGKAEFGIDVDLPGMRYATVERCPVIGGTLTSFDASQALKIPGVEQVVEVERVIGRFHFKGVAVVANSYWTAMQARKKLIIEWDTKGFETFNSHINRPPGPGSLKSVALWLVCEAALSIGCDPAKQHLLNTRSSPDNRELFLCPIV